MSRLLPSLLVPSLLAPSLVSSFLAGSLALWLPAVAAAQEVDPASDPGGAATAEEAPAQLELFVFGPDGLPLGAVELAALLPHEGGVAVEVLGVTDEGGALLLELPPGSPSLALLVPARLWQPADGAAGPIELPAAQLVAQQSTELLVTLPADGSTPRVRLEEPAGAARAGAREVDAGAPRGRVEGQIVSSEGGAPLAGVRLFVRGLDVEAETDAAGRFAMELPAGSWSLSTVRQGYASASAEAEVEVDAVTALTLTLAPSAPELDDFYVSAPRLAGSTGALLAERREAASVADVLGAEQMSAAGDSSAASALKRVSGLTVVGGRYVYVRGLGERYSATLLNGASLPSPEPERRVVPLDLFPVSMLEAVVIQKTFSPEMPAEFGGGVVRLRTRGIPEGWVARFSLSGGLNTDTTFRRGWTYQGGPTDFLGMDAGYRRLPEEVQQASDESPLEERDLFSDRGYTAAELEALGEAMPNRWNLSERLALPDLGIGATIGHGVHEEDGRARGFLLGINYKSGWSLDQVDRTYYLVGGGGQLEPSHEYRFTGLSHDVQLGGILALEGRPARGHRLRSTTILARKTDDEARIYEGFNRDVGGDIRVSRLRFVERMLLAQQFAGDHLIGPQEFELAWRYTLSSATRNEPDRREYRVDFEENTGEWLLSDRPEGNQRFFSGLRDIGHDLGGHFTIPLRFGPGPGEEEPRRGRIRFGVSAVIKDREVDTRRFKFMHKGPLSGSDEVLSQQPEDIFSHENIGSDGFQFEEITRQTDNYFAGQQLIGGYALAELPFHPRISLLAGARVEHSRQSVTTFELFNPDADPVEASLVTTDVLPAATLTFTLRPEMLLRVGYGMTVSRPDFRELSPATFNDVTGGRQTFGNPELQRARIHNVDLRWEWYPSAEESVSAAVFYKHFEQPIESIVVVSAQHSVSWDNAQAADNVGVELDVRKNFGFAHDALEDLVLAGNVSFIYSRVTLDPESGIQTSSERALQGQSPFVINLALSYDNEDIGTRASLAYNVFGRRIGEVGALGAPDTYEEPFHQLDFNFSQALGRGFRIGFKARNLINGAQVHRQGTEITERDTRGRDFSLSLSWDATNLRAPAPWRRDRGHR